MMKEQGSTTVELPASMRPSAWPAYVGVVLVTAGLLLPLLSLSGAKKKSPPKSQANHLSNPKPTLRKLAVPGHTHHDCPPSGKFHRWDGWRRSLRLAMEPLPVSLERLKPLHCHKGKPGPHDWLAHMDESGQSLRAYREAGIVKPTPLRTTIVIQPLGSFTPIQHLLLLRLSEYMKAYFCLPVRLQKPQVPQLPKRARRTNVLGEQYLTSYLAQNVLRPQLPSDAVAFLGFTAKDLWPGESWNFVYGAAYRTLRTGVWSLRRLGGDADAKTLSRRVLRRVLKVATHEAGHLFSMPHCIAYECNMNGCNHLQEMESTPMALCPVCLGKLMYNTGCNPIQRFSRLQALMTKWGLTEEARFFAQSKERMKVKVESKKSMTQK